MPEYRYDLSWVSSTWHSHGWPSFLWPRRYFIPVVPPVKVSPQVQVLTYWSHQIRHTHVQEVFMYPQYLFSQPCHPRGCLDLAIHPVTCPGKKSPPTRYLLGYTAAGRAWPTRCSSRLDMRGQPPCTSSSLLRQSGLGERRKTLVLELQDEDVRMSPSNTSLLTSPPPPQGRRLGCVCPEPHPSGPAGGTHSSVAA